MKRFFTLLVLCMLLAGCGSGNGELSVEVQRQATAAMFVPTTEETTLPVTEPSSVPTTAPTTLPTEVPTEEPTEEPTVELTEPPTQAPTEATEEPAEEEPDTASSPGQDYVLNKNTKKFHYPHCSSVGRMKAKNRKDFFGSREEVISMGYVPCKNCDP